jgi:hypothetical protein
MLLDAQLDQVSVTSVVGHRGEPVALVIGALLSRILNGWE